MSRSPPRYASVPTPISVTLANTRTYDHTLNSSASVYSLHTVGAPDVEAGPRSSLLTPNTPSYGTTPISPGVPSRTHNRRLLWNAAFKIAALFLISVLVLGGTLYLALPKLEEDDRPMLKVPKSFNELQDLNTLLKKYRDIYPFRIFLCFSVVYLFLQAFSLPGSMYMSILGGAVWGMPRALPLVCTLVATGASLCYLISAALGPALLTLPAFRTRLERWSTKIASPQYSSNLISYLVVLRIAPLPPHWVVNIVCPHVGIGLGVFWISTFLGIVGVSIIHTTIGGGLDEMTSSDDFNLFSAKNFFLLSAVVIGALFPVALRHMFKGEVASVAETEVPATAEEDDDDDVRSDRPFRIDGDGDSDIILAEGPRAAPKGKGRDVLFSTDDYDDDPEDEPLPSAIEPSFGSRAPAASQQYSEDYGEYDVDSDREDKILLSPTRGGSRMPAAPSERASEAQPKRNGWLSLDNFRR